MKPSSSLWLLLLLLLDFFQLQLDLYRNGSHHCHAFAYAWSLSDSSAALLSAELEQSKLSVFVEEDVLEVLSSSYQAEVFRVDAVLIQLRFAKVTLAPEATLVVRNANDQTNRFVFTCENASLLLHEAATPTKRPSLWNAPFVFHGSRVILEYLPASYWEKRPQVILRSIEYAVPSGARVTHGVHKVSNRFQVQQESILNGKNEMREAKCFKKKEPRMYKSARSVARLLIEKTVNRNGYGTGSSSSSGAASSDKADDSSSLVLLGRVGDQLTLTTQVEASRWYFCTGWLLGRENHLLTNHHCVFAGAQTGDAASNGKRQHRELASRQPTDTNTAMSSSGSTSGSDSSLLKSSIAKINVNFMAETASCDASGTRGQKLGVIEARQTRIVTTSYELDYALLQIIPENSGAESVELWKRYGSLLVRATGPKNREEIYIPQHPLGHPKEIAAGKDGKSAIIRVLNDSSDTQVVYNADTQPGSSGSPVVARKDNKVIALHQAGGAIAILDKRTEAQVNVGIRIDAIVEDMKSRGVLPHGALG